MFHSAQYINEKIKDFENGLITKEKLSENLYEIIEKCTIPDAIYVKEQKQTTKP